MKPLTILTVLLTALAVGCATTTTNPDGTIVEQRLDAEAALVIAQLMEMGTAQALTLASGIYTLQEAREQADSVREIQEANALMERRLAFIQAILTSLATQPTV